MTAGTLLSLTELAIRAGTDPETLRRYADDGLLGPARRQGDRYGYPAHEAEVVRLVTTAGQLGIGDHDLVEVATSWRGNDCATANVQLVRVIEARLAAVEQGIADTLAEAVAHGAGTGPWAATTRRSVALTEQAARLQAVAANLHGNQPHDECGDTCACATALDAAPGVYRFPTSTEPDAASLSCDLPADGGDMHNRIGEWQEVLSRVVARDPIPDAEAGLALRFPLDHDLAATLARLVAAEYRCCSFGSYSIVIDHTGLRLEARVPAAAADQLAATLGTPDAPRHTEGNPHAAHQP